MLRDDALKILARVCAIDRREATDVLFETWFEAIGHLEYVVAVEALKLVMQDTTDNIKPGHILRYASAARVQLERQERRRVMQLAAAARPAVES